MNGVKRFYIMFLLLAAAVLVGCDKSSPPPVPAATASDYGVPTQAQGTLPAMKIYLGAETLNAELALSARQQEIGLMFRTNITDETAMLFTLQQPIRAPDGFWMTNCPMSLSAAYIGPDGVIEEIHHLERYDNVPVVATNDNIVYVLEVNDGWFTRHNIGVGTDIRTDKGSLPDTFRR